MISNVVSWTLALAALAADPAPPSPCTPVQAGAWVPMSVAGAPAMGELVEEKSAFPGGGKWWLWNGYRPLTDSAVFDARCNAWRRTAMAKGPPVWMSRQYGLLTGPGGAVVVFGPTTRPPMDEAGAPQREFGAYALDPATLEWSDITPALPAMKVYARDDHRVVIWDDASKRGAIFAQGRWDAFTATPPPLAGHGYDCSFLLGDGWYIANPGGVFRFDFAAKAWAAVYQPPRPMPMSSDLGACTVGFSGPLAVATVKPLYAEDRMVFGIEGATAFQVPWPEGGADQAIVAAGGTAWSTLFRRYDRATGKWTAPRVPQGALYVFDFQGQARLGMDGQMAVWNGKRFGAPVPLAPGPPVDLPPPPKPALFREFSPELAIAWGFQETYTALQAGGFFLLRAP